MESLHRVSTSDLQRFLNAPEELLRETKGIQISVASFSETPRSLLEVLVKSDYSEVVEVARLHVNWVDEERDYREAVSEVLRDKDLGENDRLAVELMRFAPVAPEFLSEWVPVDKLIQGLKNQYMPLRYRLQLLERLSREGELEARLQVAESLETPVSILELLAGDIDLAVRLAVKYNDNCPLNVVELVKSQHDLASDWDTDVRYLEELGKSRWGWVRFAVAQNPYASEDVLMRLAGDDEFRIRLAVAKNPGTSAGVLNVLMEGDTGIYGVIAKNPNATEEILHQLFSNHRDVIKKRDNLPASVLEKFFRQTFTEGTLPWKYKYRYLLLEQPNTPTWILAELANVDLEAIKAETSNFLEQEIHEELIWDDISFLKDIAEHPQVSQEILERLAQESNPYVKLAVAQSQHTPEEFKLLLLEELITYNNEEIRVKIAKNPNTPINILELIVSDIEYVDIENSIVLALIGNPNTPVSLRESLKSHFISNSGNSIELIFALAYNQQIPETERIRYFEQLFAKTDDYIQEKIATNPNTPQNIINRIMSKKSVARQAVAKNKNAPANVLAELAKDENNTTRGWIAENPGTPPDILVELARQPIEKKVGINWVIDKNVRDAAFKNPNFPLLERYRLSVETELGDETRNAHQLMSKRIDSPYSLAQVVEKGDVNSKYTAASNPKTPIHILEQLAKDADETVRSVVVNNPNLPSGSLMELAQDSIYYVRISVARRSHPTSKDVLLLLSQSDDTNIRWEIARNKNTPSDILISLAEDEKNDVRLNALRNANIPSQVVLQALSDIEYENEKEIEYILTGQGEIMRNSLMSPKVLERLSYHPKNFIRYVVATYPTASAKTLERLAFDKHESIGEKVAENPSTPASVLIELASCDRLTTYAGCYHTISNKIAMRKDAPPEALEHIVRQPVAFVAIQALRNANTPISALEWLAENQNDESILCALVEHPNITPDIWIRLSTNESVNVRKTVASQDQCPLEILETLANDSAIEVQEKVAANPNTPNAILETFAQNENTAIRKAVGSNPNLSQITLEQLANDEKIEVRRQVAQNPNTPSNIRENLRDSVLLLKKQRTSPTLNSLSRIYNPSSDDLATLLTEYADSENAFVRFVVLLHPVTPHEILTQGLNSASWLERYAVAENQATSLEMREILARDGNWIVKAAANQNLSNSN